MSTLTLQQLTAEAIEHKKAVRYHRAQLRRTLTRINEIKAALESVGITEGEATGDERHGHREATLT